MKKSNTLLKVLWGIVFVMFIAFAIFLGINYFGKDSSTTKKESKQTTTQSDKKDNDNKTTEESKKESSEKNSSESTNSNEKTDSVKKDSGTTSKSEKTESTTEKKTETKNDNSVEGNTNNTTNSNSNNMKYPRSFEYNGRALSPIAGIGSTGKVFATQNEALEYGQSEIERLVKEDKKNRQYAVGRVLYEDNSMAGWTVDIYEN